jgi:hypothetical protein
MQSGCRPPERRGASTVFRTEVIINGDDGNPLGRQGDTML